MPAISLDWHPAGEDIPFLLEWVKGQLSEKDGQSLDFLLKGFKGSNLDKNFYEQALGSKVRFLREYFKEDLLLRNAKTMYLNSALGRNASDDVIDLLPTDSRRDLDEIFRKEDLMAREKAIDDHMWNKANEITTFEYFSLDKILCMAAQMMIIQRWLALDEEEGRKMFNSLVADLRSGFDGQFNENQKITI